MKLCCVFNYNPLYRLPIYKAMDDAFGCDFYFGDTVFQNIERFDASQLKGFKHFIHAKKVFRGYIWHSRIKGIFSRQYTHYLLTGSSRYLVNWLIYIYAFFSGKKVYLWTHGINAHIEKPLSRLYCRLFYLPVTGVFLYGHHAVPYMEEIGCKKETLFVIHNSLDTPLQTRLFEAGLKSTIYQDYFKNDNPVVVYTGRLQKRKHIDLLIRAIANCHKNGFQFNLVLIGPKEDDDSLASMVCDFGIESSVWLFGPSYDENVTSRLLFNADVCVCPAAVGLTSIHSLSYGTPVVSNNDFNNQMPEYEAIVNGVTGSFYEKGSVEDLSHHIQRWCLASAVEREETRERARESILKEWSVEYQLGILKTAFQE